MQTLLYVLACLALAPLLYVFLNAVIRGYQNSRRRLPVQSAAQQIAGLISKVDPDHHGKLFSQVGGRLIDLGVFHAAGACYRISVEIYDEQPVAPPNTSDYYQAGIGRIRRC